MLPFPPKNSISYLCRVYFCFFRRIQDIINSYVRSLDVELQQRSCEYVNIFGRGDSEVLR